MASSLDMTTMSLLINGFMATTSGEAERNCDKRDREVSLLGNVIP